jgi:hypothetical protein
MDWTKESSKDSLFLQRLGLEPIDPALAGGDQRLEERLGENNEKVAMLTSRFAALAKDRERLVDHQNWLDAGAADILTYVARLRQESWDSLLDVRELLEYRGAILEGLFTAASQRVAELSSQHDAIRDRAAKALKREHHHMVAANPVTAGRHFAELVDSAEDVAAACQKTALAQAILERVLTARRKQENNLWTVNARQREVFPLVAA